MIPAASAPLMDVQERKMADSAGYAGLLDRQALQIGKQPASAIRRLRRIIAEDPEWSLYTVPPLTDLCLQHIITNFESHPIVEKLIPKHQEHVLQKLSTSLPLSVTANLISDEGYWQRCCTKRWEICDTSSYGGSWKRMFFERHLENIIEHFIPGVTDLGVIRSALPLCKQYVKKLNITQLLPPIKMDLRKQDEEEDTSDSGSDNGTEMSTTDHLDLGFVIGALSNLEELHLVYGVKSCGMNFEWNLFDFTYPDCFSLAKLLKICKTLKVFKLYKSKVDDVKARVLINSLLEHPSLVHLDLSHNLIGDRGARAVGKLINHSKLETIDLCNNRIQANGAQVIALALTRNSILTSLNLRLNRLGDEGGQAICHALLTNSTLTNLHLGSNELSEPTGIVLSLVLSRNKVLRTINLSSNRIGMDGGKQLVEGMSDNKTVVEFDLRLTEVGQESEFCINQILRNNQERARLRALQNQPAHPLQYIPSDIKGR
ncbi:dynein regulatory complex subunit 5 [Rhinatrema bivittatum]|uniref:dynein regulatory complex subunit 5-like n=1 Tax=Rhinatrema bivittatum TaxID=194408 RepID=UPI00112BDE79|nr:dynein regulatory complex subunit 5-like [Rhinatrema bivittatum]XP_029442480.1 dynein regulatory complex subunit 5-like [Rhinatrema bivittatum]XP_029448742.1 dynein regulatory complex subunit 5 [Rhinatrema bivittatum]XP_029448743.1 dynein regulatory complex subunit 5 [Rhinatrema bivittatum]